MKKLLIILLFALPVLLYGQNTFKYRVDALGGIKVGTNGAVLDSIKASTAEINYVDGVTSPIQTQLNTKLAKTDTSTLSNRIDAINLDTLDSHDVHPNWADSATINGWTSKTDFNAGQALKVDVADTTGYASGNYVTPTQLDEASKDNFLRGIKTLSSPVKAITMCTSNFGVNNSGMVDGIIYWLLVNLDKSDSITGVGFVLGTQGNYTADKNNKIGVYSISGTTYTLVDSSANNGDLWKATAHTLTQVPFSGGKHYLKKGVYLITLLWNASATTAAPAMYASSSFNNNGVNVLFSSVYDIVGSTAGSDLPASIAADDVGATTSTYNVILY